MDINKLMATMPDMAVFALVVEAGSFTAAAERLNVTPSAVSRQISRLENALQVRLLERTTRRQIPTPEGEMAYEKCQAMLELGADVAQLSTSNAQVEGNIHFAAPKAYARHILMPLVNQFLIEHPKVNLRFTVLDTLMNPQRDNVDLAVRLSHRLIEGLVSKPLHPLKMILCASPEYLARFGMPQKPNDLLQHSCITLGEVPEDYQWRFCRTGQEEQPVEVSGRYANNHSEMRLSAAKAGLGISILPEFVALESIVSGTLSKVLPEWNLISRYRGMVTLQYSQNKYMPSRLRTFIDFLVQNLSE